jgi:hypothetical protein
MRNLTTIIQFIDQTFTSLIFIPMCFILYCRFFPYKERGRRTRIFYRVCIILVILFLLRYFCDKFIFTAVNYPRFTDSGLFPLIQAVFYPEVL